ncbi:M15 family metallopeptidase, partial [uncultured Akkermansia sp.]
GKSKSMHAWGIALDFDPVRNSYSCKAPHAGLSRPECEEWWRIWEAHGAVSLGRERNYDWMHLQFARL